METLLRDVKHAFRGMGKEPGFSLITILILGLGLGAVTLVYSLVRGALLQPFPFPDLDRLVMVWTDIPTTGTKAEAISGPDYVELRESGEIFDDLSGGVGFSLNLTSGEGDPEHLQGLLAPPQLFSLLGVDPALGRTFTAEEDSVGGPKVVILSHRIWQRRFGGDRDLIGQSISLNDQSYTVVGVMPSGFRFGRADFWAPLSNMVSTLIGNDIPNLPRSYRLLWTVARLQPDVSVERANVWLEQYAQRVEQEHSAAVPDYKDWEVTVQPLREYFIGEVKDGIWALVGAVGFVLVIICGNVANLILARTLEREKELALRLTLGASRGRITRQLLTENLIFAVLGGLLGWALAAATVGPIASLIPDRFISEEPHFAIDGSVLGVLWLVTLGMVVLFGFLPALRFSRPDYQSTLKEGGRKSTGGGMRMRQALVIGEVALALVVAVGFAFFIQGFFRLAERDTGIQKPEEILTFHVQLPRARYGGEGQALNFHNELHDRIRGLPGVESSGSVLLLPLEDFIPITQRLMIEGQSADDQREAVYRPTTAGYFDALGISLTRGRFLDTTDTSDGAPAVVVNRAFAETFFSLEDAIGRRIRLANGNEQEPWRTIVGITENVAQRRLSQEPGPTIYLPLTQITTVPNWMRLAVRASVPPETLLNPIRGEVAAMDAGLPIFNDRTMQEAIDRDLGGWKLCVLLLAGFAVIALAVVAIGLYGVISYSTAQRTHEFGVRMALGAEQRNVLWLVLKQGLWMTGIGLILGTFVSLFLTRWMSSLSLDIGTVSPLIFVGALIFLTAISLLASTAPAWRATRTDPLEALRYE